MSDINHLINALNLAKGNSKESVLATVVKVEGSAYRRPGARMLISQYGGTQGTISGGCLEADVAKKAWWHTEQKPNVLCYNTAVDDDETGYERDETSSDSPSIELFPNRHNINLEFGLGCNGKVYVLLERLPHHSHSPLLSLLEQVHQQGAGGVAATVIGLHPCTTSINIGDRVTIAPDGTVNSSIQHTELDRYIRQQLSTSLQQQRSANYTFEIDDSPTNKATVEIFFDYIKPVQKLVIFGAGDDVKPLVSMAKLMNMHVTVIDSRAHYARKERFPDADRIIHSSIETQFPFSADIKDSYVTVMTHSLTQDKHWLSGALLSSARYIGQLGPRYRTEKLLEEIEEGASASETTILRHNRYKLHYPIGIKLDASTPESIAVSICAQLVDAMSQPSQSLQKTDIEGGHNQESDEDVTIYIEE